MYIRGRRFSKVKNFILRSKPNLFMHFVVFFQPYLARYWILLLSEKKLKHSMWKKRWQKNTPNVGGENAAKVSWQKIRQNVNNSVESWRLQTRTENSAPKCAQTTLIRPDFFGLKYCRSFYSDSWNVTIVKKCTWWPKIE